MINRRQLVQSGMFAFASVTGIEKNSLAQSTPMPTPVAAMWGGVVKRTVVTTQVLWGAHESELPGLPGWRPVSFRSTDYEGDTYAFVELKNVSGVAALGPRLYVEALQGDFSFGESDLDAQNPWVEAEGSAFYYSSSFFGGSIGNSDWDGMNLRTAENSYRVYEGFDAGGIRIEQDRLYNERSEMVPPVYTGVFLRDKEGIFTAGCSGPSTGANTPPNGSLRLSSSADPDYEPMCGFSMAGEAASEDLGVGEPYISEYFVTGFDN